MAPMNPRLLRPLASGVHPEAAAWRSAVVANGGGTPSALTMRAVSKLCADIDAAGIRDRFFRLGIFAGPSLNSALVPLYRGPSRTGTQYGNTTDTNNGPFDSSDYNETGASGGLLGNGTSKYLDTGLATSNYLASAASGHLSAYHSTPSGPSANRSFIGSSESADKRFYLQNSIFGTAASTGFFGWVAAVTQNLASQTGAPAGHRVLSRTSGAQADLVQYENAVSVGTPNAGLNVDGVSSVSLYVHALNTNGTAGGFNNGRILAYSIGLGMTAQQVTDFYNAMQAFQTALSRQL